MKRGAFAAGLSQRVSVKRQETKEREKDGKKWAAHENKLLDAVLEIFKGRCTRAAHNMQCQLAVSFEVLTREVTNFPSYIVKDSTYLVDTWGDADPSWWWYANRSATDHYEKTQTIQFAEVLESMMPKFVEKVRELGFKTCSREAGSWKVKVTWKSPDAEEENDKEPGSAKSSDAGTSCAESAAARPKQKAREESKRRRTSERGSESPSHTEVPSGTEVPSSDDEANKK